MCVLLNSKKQNAYIRYLILKTNMKTENNRQRDNYTETQFFQKILSRRIENKPFENFQELYI